MLKFLPKPVRARGVKIETADDVKAHEAKHPGVAIGDYVVEYASRPGIEVHEKGQQFESAYEPAPDDGDVVAIAVRVDELEKRIEQLEGVPAS